MQGHNAQDSDLTCACCRDVEAHRLIPAGSINLSRPCSDALLQQKQSQAYQESGSFSLETSGCSVPGTSQRSAEERQVQQTSSGLEAVSSEPAGLLHCASIVPVWWGQGSRGNQASCAAVLGESGHQAACKRTWHERLRLVPVCCMVHGVDGHPHQRAGCDLEVASCQLHVCSCHAHLAHSDGCSMKASSAGPQNLVHTLQHWQQITELQSSSSGIAASSPRQQQQQQQRTWMHAHDLLHSKQFQVSCCTATCSRDLVCHCTSARRCTSQ